MVTLSTALDTVMQLPSQEIENLIDILNKRRSQNWRIETAEYYKNLKMEVQSGKLIPKTPNEVINELHEFLDK